MHLLLSLFLSLPALAGSFLSIDGEQFFYEHKPAAMGAPTLVLLNGLTYSTESWNAFAKSLETLNPKIGILRYDMRGMGETLQAGTLPVQYAIPYGNQATTLKKILGKLKIKKAALVGLSYGAGIGLEFARLFPNSVTQLIVMAPFTEPLEAQDRLIRMQVAANRLAFPFNPATDDELYDFFLRQFIYATYPQAEPVLLGDLNKLEAVFRMVQGIRFFRATDISKELDVPVHLLVANQDQYIPQEVMDRFWKSLPKRVRGSRINISETEHKIPEAIPDFSAAWVLECLSNAELQKGKVFSGSTERFEARSGSLVISLKR